jgi:hypothetical protein
MERGLSTWLASSCGTTDAARQEQQCAAAAQQLVNKERRPVDAEQQPSKG